MTPHGQRPTLDALLLACCGLDWRKADHVVGLAAMKADLDDEAGWDMVARRLAILVAAGRIEADGDLANWHGCEVRRVGAA